MNMIYLNKEQAEKVRGRHGKYSELQPIEIDNGMFMLPVNVLKDIEHKDVFIDLIKCQLADINKIEVVDKTDVKEVFKYSKTISTIINLKDLNIYLK